MDPESESAALPLEGLRILDLSWLGVGCIATWLLAEMGAEVIKVEPPDGSDNLRTLPPFYKGQAVSHLTFDRNKRSLAVNLRDPRGRDAYLAVAATADAVVEGFRPGVADRLGIGYANLRQTNARIVYCSVTGFGAGGPLEQTAGHDLNYIAQAGMLSLSWPAPHPPPLQPADYIGAALAAFAVMAGVNKVHVTGQGIAVEGSLFNAAVYSLTYPMAQALLLGVDPGPGGYRLFGGLACYAAYRCRDGKYLTVAALEPKFWKRFCELTGIHEEIENHHDPARQEHLRTRVAAVLASKDTDEWLRIFHGEDVCVAPVLGLVEAVHQPQLRARGGLTPALHPDGGKLQLPAGPLKVSGTSNRESRVPGLGEDTQTLLQQAGVSGTEIEELALAGVIATSVGQVQTARSGSPEQRALSGDESLK